jgi:hypothetical protein
MPANYEIRADFDAKTIIVYQAYSPTIALPALKAKKFVAPFSFNRMTWIKPSFLWLMERSNWGQKSGQECTLAIRISRSGWEEALSLGILTTPEPAIYPNHAAWKTLFDNAQVHIQWDTERSIRGSALNYETIQVELSRHIIKKYVDEWIVDIQDYTALVSKLYKLINSGHSDKAKKLLPPERIYPLKDEFQKRLFPSR